MYGQLSRHGVPSEVRAACGHGLAAARESHFQTRPPPQFIFDWKASVRCSRSFTPKGTTTGTPRGHESTELWSEWLLWQLPVRLSPASGSFDGEAEVDDLTAAERAAFKKMVKAELKERRS